VDNILDQRAIAGIGRDRWDTVGPDRRDGQRAVIGSRELTSYRLGEKNLLSMIHSSRFVRISE